MNKIDTRGLLFRIFIPAIVLSLSYLVMGHFCNMPHILLFCILGTVTLMPIELGMILFAGKKNNLYLLWCFQCAAWAGNRRIIF